MIADVDDPVTDYLPELAVRDARSTQITLRHLLTMSSGIRYTEPDLPWPWSDDTSTYYGTDLRAVALQESQVVAAKWRCPTGELPLPRFGGHLAA